MSNSNPGSWDKPNRTHPCWGRERWWEVVSWVRYEPVLTNQVLAARREPLAVLQIGKELLGISAPVVGGALRNKAKHLHAAVHADPEVPRLSADVDCADGFSDGVDVAEAGEPGGGMWLVGGCLVGGGDFPGWGFFFSGMYDGRCM